MVGFQTSNSIYFIDERNKTISGGIFRDKREVYISIRAIVGDNAFIETADGKIIKTGKVIRYL